MGALPTGRTLSPRCRVQPETRRLQPHSAVAMSLLARRRQATPARTLPLEGGAPSRLAAIYLYLK
jgi:hypothetical protein